MNLSKLLFKPKWQHKDPAIRRVAVTSERAPELVAVLPNLARDDENAGVRLAALKRVDDFSLYRERALAESDGAVRSYARERYLALLTGLSQVDERNIADLDKFDAGEIERLAQAAQDPKLRGAALARVQRPGLLIERASGDPSADLRLAALLRIDDPVALNRIIEKTRKSDKTLNRLARERLESLQIAAGDTTAIGERARGLCDRLEVLVREPGAQLSAEIERIAASWQAIAEQAAPDLRKRYTSALALLTGGLDAAAGAARERRQTAERSAADEAARVEAIVEIAVPTIAPTSTPAPVEVSAEHIEAQRRRDTATAKRREREQAWHGEWNIALPAYLAALDAGDTAQARQRHAQLVELRRQLGDTLARAAAQAWSDSEAKFQQLAQWQHWSNSQRRRALCEEIEALPAAALHPDAVATKVRAARDEWQLLDAAEGIGTAETQGLARHFQGLCHKALKPTKVYFNKRDELRKSQRDQLESLLTQIAAVPADSDDWKGIFNLRLTATKSLRDLERVDPRERQALAKRLKDAAATLSARLQAHEQGIEQAKAKLIAQAQALAESAAAGAPREVKELQKRWQSAGNGRRNVDQAQWQQFRTACDAVFGKLDGARREREAQDSETRTRAESLIGELEMLRDALGGADTPAASLREVEARWQELASEDRALQGRWRNALDSAQQAAAQRRRARVLQRYPIALEKYSLLRELEIAAIDVDALQARWTALPSAANFDAALDHRLARATQSPADPTVEAEVDTDEALQLLVQLELLAGVASPESERQRRMDYQVSRLSQRMRGDSNASSVGVELDGLLNAWLDLPAISDAQGNAMDRRFRTAYMAAVALIPAQSSAD